MALTASAGSLLGARLTLAAGAARPLDVIRSDWRQFAPVDIELSVDTTRLEKEKQAWRDELDDDAYRVLFEEGTERPFSSALDAEKRPGVYLCAACGLPLFTSEMKFDSGTGWPSFFTHIPDHLGTKIDLKLVWPRTEYHCLRCRGHQGHVFDDGPRPTGQRWCNNGVALRFLPR
jgi:peptide-methionine (R)-S-oxide reductase